MLGRAWSRIAKTLLVAALVLSIPMAALADPPDRSGVVERAPELSAWVHWDGELIVLNGPPQDAATCLGLATEGFDYEGFSKPSSTIVTTPSGSRLLSVTHTDHVWVYDDEDTDDPLEWLFGGCAAMLAGAPAPEPLAHGEGLVQVKSRIDADGVQHGPTTITARVTTADGRNVHLNVVGAELGEFPDFINYGG